MRTVSPRQPIGRIAAAALLLALAAGATAAQPPLDLTEARRLFESGRAEEAAARLDDLLRRGPDAEALLLRSTVRFVLGRHEEGRTDLARALEIAPDLRQGWLNLAALNISEERFDEALAALERARDLDPAAPDNALNIGAVLLLQGRLDEANTRFRSYLESDSESAEAHYLVASNYALAGYSTLALRLLGRAITLDERIRLRARTDPNFGDLEADPEFQRLLLTDGFSPPPGSHRATRRFPVSYEGVDSGLLAAVLDALQIGGRPFDPRIEATPEWALIWSDFRIKVSRAPDGSGIVSLSAPAGTFQPDQWRSASEELFRQIAIQIHSRERRSPPGG